ncbi:hypothetical protein D3C76_938920 [compost metagenome]
MEDRERVNQPVIGAEAPGITQGTGIGEQVAMAEHGAFGAARSAGGVENGCQVVAGTRHRLELGRGHVDPFAQAALPLFSEGLQRSAMLQGDCRQCMQRLGADDKDPWRRIAEEIIELGWRVGRVERQVDRAAAQRAQVQHQRIDAFIDLHCHPVTRQYTEATQGVGKLSGARECLAISEWFAGGGFQQQRSRRRGPEQGVEQIAVH